MSADKKSKMTFDCDNIDVFAYLEDIEDLYVHIGTYIEFESFIQETEDLTCGMHKFTNRFYYALFYDYQKSKNMTQIRKVDYDSFYSNFDSIYSNC